MTSSSEMRFTVSFLFPGEKTKSMGRADAYRAVGHAGDAVGGVDEQSAVAGGTGTQADATHPQDPGKLVDGGGRSEEQSALRDALGEELLPEDGARRRQ